MLDLATLHRRACRVLPPQIDTCRIVLDVAGEAGLMALLLPLELGLTDLPEFRATPEGASRLRNGNPGQVLGHADWGTEGWASLDGLAVAVGHYRGGELHPSRVFNR